MMPETGRGTLGAKWSLIVGVSLGLGLTSVLPACFERSPSQEDTPTASKAASSVASTSAVRPAPGAAHRGTSEFGCDDLRPLTDPQRAWSAETIRLNTPLAMAKKIVLAKTGVIVSFNRDDFLVAARCLKLDKALEYTERETGQAHESPLRDAFQLTYVAAALLDAGRASVRLEDEDELHSSIVREWWSEEGCAGRCRSYGRIYRLSASDPSFFLRVTDKAVNSWEKQEAADTP